METWTWSTKKKFNQNYIFIQSNIKYLIYVLWNINVVQGLLWLHQLPKSNIWGKRLAY